MGDRNRKRRGSKKTHPVNNSSSFSDDKTPPTSPTTSNFKNYQRRLRRSYSTGGKSKHNTTSTTISRSFKSQLQQRGRWHNFLEEFVPPVPHRFDTDHDGGGGRATAAVNGGGNDTSVTCRSPRRVGGNRRIYREQKSARNNNTPKSKRRVPHKKSKRRAVVRFDENTGLGLLRSWSDSDGGKLRVYADSSDDDDDSSSSSSSSESDSSSSSSSSNDGSSSTGRVNQVGVITASNNIMMGARSSSLPPNYYYYRNLVWGETETARQQQQQHYSHHGDTTVHSYYSQYQKRSRSFQYGDVYRRSDKDDKRNNLHPLAFFAEFLGEDLPPPPTATASTRNQPQDSQVDVQSVMSSLGSYAEFLPEEEEEEDEEGNDELSQNDSLAYSSSSSVSLVQRSLLEEEENQEQQQQYPLTTEEEEEQQLAMVEQHCPQQSALDEEHQQQQEHQQQFDTLRLLTRSTSPLTTIAEDSIETLSATSVSSPLDSSEKKNKGNIPVNKAVKGTAGGNHHPNAVDTVFPSKRAYSRGSGSKGIKFRERFMYNWDDGLYDNVAIQEKTSSSLIPLCAADVAAGVAAAATNPTSSPNSVNNNTDTAEDPSGSNDNITASSSSIEAYKRNETGSSLKTASTADSTVFSGMPTYSRHHSATSQSSAYTFSSMKSYLSQSQIRNLEDAPPELVDVLNQQLSILKTRRQDILEKAKLRNDKSSRKKLNIDDSIRVENSIQFSLFVMKDKVEQLQDILGPLSVEVF